MNKKTPTTERAKMIDRGIRLAYDSLVSHLPHTQVVGNKDTGSVGFHKLCVQQYGEIIYILTKLY